MASLLTVLGVVSLTHASRAVEPREAMLRCSKRDFHLLFRTFSSVVGSRSCQPPASVCRSSETRSDGRRFVVI